MNENLVDEIKRSCSKAGVIIDKIKKEEATYVVFVKKYNPQKIDCAMFLIRQKIKYGLVVFKPSIDWDGFISW